MSVQPHAMRSRSQWTSSAPRGATQQLRKGRFPLVIHYSAGDGRHLDKLAEQKAAIRSMRDFHIGPERGWDDIGYNGVITQPWGSRAKANIWVARGANRIPAANGEGNNRGTLTYCVIADDNDFIMQRTIEAIAFVAVRYGANAIKGHRDYIDTSCPGDRLYNLLRKARAIAGVR